MDTEANLAPAVEIELDRTRHLKFDLNAACQIEEHTGKNYFKLLGDGLTASDLRVVLWAGLVHEDDTLTIDQIGSMIHPGKIITLMESISEAVTASLPEQKNETVEAPTERPLAAVESTG